MKGLDAIKDKIIETSEERAKEVLDRAEQEAHALVEEAKSKAKDASDQADLLYKKEEEALLTREKSLAALESRKIRLAMRQELIDAVLDKAMVSLTGLPPAEKKALYAAILADNLQGGERVRFAAADLPLAEEIKAGSARDFEVDANPGDFSGGLLIVRDRIDINLTFEMTLEKNRQELVALAAQELFGDKED